MELVTDRIPLRVKGLSFGYLLEDKHVAIHVTLNTKGYFNREYTRI